MQNKERQKWGVKELREILSEIPSGMRIKYISTQLTDSFEKLSKAQSMARQNKHSNNTKTKQRKRENIDIIVK